MENNKKLPGNPVSPGIAIAKAYVYHPLEIAVEERCFPIEEEPAQIMAFEQALARTKEELYQLYSKLVERDKKQAEIFLAQRQILEDETLFTVIRTEIAENCLNPDYAVAKVFDDYKRRLSAVSDARIAERVADLEDVKKRLIRNCQGKEEKNLSVLPEEIIVVAHELLPSDMVSMNRQRVKGIITEVGGTYSHTAILARSFQIPMLTSVTDAVMIVPDGVIAAVNALDGVVVVEPELSELKELEVQRAEFEKQREMEEKYLNTTCRITDGTAVEIGINIGSSAVDFSMDSFDFVGLFRTEFLYMENTHWPTEEEQFSVYKEVLERAGRKTVTLRTLDVGGEKKLPYMDTGCDDCGLELRGVRFCFSNPEIFLTQLRAALRASAFGPLQIMFPMVETMEDIYKAKTFVKQAMEQLELEGEEFDRNIRIGVMIETPSIARAVDRAVEEVDFASIGTNDLMQSMMGNLPEVMELIENIVRIFSKQGKELSVCGELAGNQEMSVALVKLGIRKLSMDATNIAAVKEGLHNLYTIPFDVI